jgi:hypothetical protein
LIPPRQNETQLFRYSLLTYCGSETFALPSRYSRPANSPQRNGPEGHHDILIIPVRDDVPYDAAKAEIITYIETPGNEDLSIGEIARKLRLDLDIVIDVFEERGLL